MITRARIAGAIFVGGRGTRMGETDKALLEVNGSTLIEFAVREMRALGLPIVISAPDEPVWMRRIGGAVHVPDIRDEHGSMGPAGGLAAVLSWARAEEFDFVFTVPVDAPFWTSGVYSALQESTQLGQVSVAVTEDYVQAMFAMWSTKLADKVQSLVLDRNTRAMHRLLTQCGAIKVPFTEQKDLFLNLNTPQDLEKAQMLRPG